MNTIKYSTIKDKGHGFPKLYLTCGFYYLDGITYCCRIIGHSKRYPITGTEYEFFRFKPENKNKYNVHDLYGWWDITGKEYDSITLNPNAKLVEFDENDHAIKTEDKVKCIWVEYIHSFLAPNKSYVYFSDGTKTAVKQDNNPLHDAIDAIMNSDGTYRKFTKVKLEAIYSLTKHLERTQTEKFETDTINDLIAGKRTYKGLSYES